MQVNRHDLETLLSTTQKLVSRFKEDGQILGRSGARIDIGTIHLILAHLTDVIDSDA